MTWWIAFIIAVIGWYFTATQNAKNSTRSLINQEIKEARTKLHELIVSCSGDDCELPLKPMSENYIKMQTYIVAVQELDDLYSSYKRPVFRNILVIDMLLSIIEELFKKDSVKKVNSFVCYWFLPREGVVDRIKKSSAARFEVSEHVSYLRQTLTSDDAEANEEIRLAALHLQYRHLFLAYQFVS